MTDLDNGGAGASVDLHLALTGMAAAQREQTALLRRRFEKLTPAPVFYRPAASVVAAGTGSFIVPIAGPDQGHFQYVRSVTVGAQQVGTAGLTGTADVYVTAGQLPAAPSLLDWRDRAVSLPQKAFYGRGELSLQFGEQLFVVFTVTAVVAGTTLVAIAQVEDYQEHSGTQEWSL